MLMEIHAHLFLYLLLLLLPYIHTDKYNLFTFHVMHLGYYLSVLCDNTVRRHCVDIYMKSFIHSFHRHVQNATIPCHSQETLPFLSAIYPFRPPFSTN